MGRPQVLLVDDDPEVVKFLGLLLELEGFEPALAPCGEEALAVALRDRPAAALVDVAMPDMDGLELCRRLRSSGYEGAVLMVSARPGLELPLRAVQAGADEFIRKPFDNGDLLARLRHWMAARSPGAEL